MQQLNPISYQKPFLMFKIRENVLLEIVNKIKKKDITVKPKHCSLSSDYDLYYTKKQPY